MNIPWFTCLFLLCLGAGVTYAGIAQKRKTTKLLKNGIKAEGEVLELVPTGVARNSNFYKPVIRFETLAKESITHKSDIGVSYSVYKVGDKLTVIYEQDNPTDFMIDDKRSKIAGTLFMVVGIIVLAIAFLLFAVSLLS
jgi:hypothetical protein